MDYSAFSTRGNARVGTLSVSPYVIKVNGSVDMAGDLHGVAGLAY